MAVADLGWRNGKRDRREFTGPDPKTAMDRRDAFLHARRGGFTLPKGRQPYVSEWCMYWLENIAREKVAATTFDRSYRQKVTELICPFFERIRLPELAEEDIRAWHQYLARKRSQRTDRPLAAATIVQAHRILSAALKVAVVEGKTPRNPASNVSPPRITRPEPEPPTAEEIRLVMERCGTWPNGPRWIIAIATGIRQGEALGLRWRDVHLDTQPPTLRVARTAVRTAQGLAYKEPKSAKGKRTIQLGDVAAEALRRQRRQQREDRLAAAAWEDSDLVFARANGKPRDSRADWADWQALLADLGVRPYRVHDLRHLTATALLEAGMDARLVQEIMGHATAAFTQQTYQHVRPVLHQRAADAMDAYLRGS